MVGESLEPSAGGEGENWMAAKVELLIPQGTVRVPQKPPSSRLDGLAGKVIGFVNNGKPNADVFLSRLANLMQKKYRLSGILLKAKPRPSVPAEFIEELAMECQAVVNAVGD
jgi:hypothetical protein